MLWQSELVVIVVSSGGWILEIIRSKKGSSVLKISRYPEVVLKILISDCESGHKLSKRSLVLITCVNIEVIEVNVLETHEQSRLYSM